MAVKDHNALYGTNDIVVYKTYNGGFNGYKLVKEVYIALINEYRWIGVYGRIKDNKFEVTEAQEVFLLSDKDIKAGYPKTWTPDPEFNQGDILEGTDYAGRRVVLLYQNESLVHRLTDMSGASQTVSSAGLSYYQGKLSNIKVVKASYDGRPFSQLLK